MDSKQFDELVARLASGQSRRKALQGIAGGALATLGVTSVATAKGKKARAQGKKKAKAQACIPTGKKCPAPKPRGNGNLGCNKCCQRHSEKTANGKTKCACKPNGTDTPRAAYCCSAVARAGRCVAY